MTLPQVNVGEIYEDAQGNRWIVSHHYDEPTVGMSQLIPYYSGDPVAPPKMFGGRSGFMWNGFKKIADAPVSRPTTKAGSS